MSTIANITVDLARIGEKEFDPSRPLRVVALRGDTIIDQKTITPAQEKNPRRVTVQLSLGDAHDGVAGADVVVAPADDHRNVFSKLTARKFVSGAAEKIDGVVIAVNPNIYAWWRLCWFPRTYRISGRLLRHADNCAHPVGGATVEIYDVDYCWWWFTEDLLKTGVTDANGFFDITFTWCVPLWCIFEVLLRPPFVIDPALRDRLLAIVNEKVIVRFPPPPPPPDPWTFERQLTELGVALPAVGRLQPANLALQSAPRMTDRVSGAQTVQAATAAVSASGAVSLVSTAARFQASDLFREVLRRPPCDSPCDWLPDIKIRVTQNQSSGTVVIYEDSYWDVHFDLDSNLLNLTLEANANAVYPNDCAPDPILGNCMLLDAVGVIHIMPTGGDPLSGIYQPDVTPGISYGVTPDRRQRLGYVKNYDRAFAATVSVYGRFGLGAHVDYYQVQAAQWSAGDLLAWDADHTHVPPDAAFAPVPATAIVGFTRSYLVESPTPHWPDEPFSPQTVGGIPLVFKTRERFEQEYRDSHGGLDPAPDFGGWYCSYFTETRLFSIDSSKMSNGLYTFRFVCYQQTGVDGMGNPVLAPVNMGLAGGVGKRCTTARPELVTLYLNDTPHTPDCEILTFKKNGVDVIDECAMVTLTSSDWVELSYQAFDGAGNLDSYEVTLQKGFSGEQDILTLAGVSAVSGSVPEGPGYGAALVDPSPVVPPYWFGGSWTKKVPYSSFVAMGGNCAYNLRVRAWDRQTDGYSAGSGWGYVACDKNRAFTVILA